MSDGFISPYELLKYFQKGHYEKITIDNNFFEDLLKLYPPNEQERMLTQRAEIIAKYKVSEHIKIPLDSQQPFAYFILYSLINDIEDILKQNNIDLDKKIVFGTVPITKINAGRRNFKGNETLILVYEGLFDFFYFMAADISSFFVKSNESSINKEVYDLNPITLENSFNSNIFGHEKFVEIMRCFRNKNFLITTDWFKTDFHKNVAEKLWYTAELFSVAHEYGHILLNHDSSTISIMNEYEADYTAFRITIAENISKKWGVSGAYWGIDFMFSCMEFIEEIDTSYIYYTHPTALERKLILRSIFKELFPQNYINAFEIADINSNLLLKLWNIHKDDII